MNYVTFLSHRPSQVGMVVEVPKNKYGIPIGVYDVIDRDKEAVNGRYFIAKECPRELLDILVKRANITLDEEGMLVLPTKEVASWD